MSTIFGPSEWFTSNSQPSDWVGNSGATVLPLGLCKQWGMDENGLFFDTWGSGDPEWMRHVFETLYGLGVSFLAGVYSCSDKNDPHGPDVFQFCVIIEAADAARFMPQINAAYDIAQSVTGGTQ